MIKANYCSGICIDQYAMKRDAYLLNALACSRQLAPAKGIGKCMVEDFDFPLCLELMVNTAIKTRLLFENNQADIPLPNPKVAHLVSTSGSKKTKNEESLKQTCNLIGHHSGCWFKPFSDICDGTSVIIAVPPLHDATDRRHRLYEICLRQFAQAAYAAMTECEECAQAYYEIEVDENTGLPILNEDDGLPDLFDAEYIGPSADDKEV